MEGQLATCHLKSYMTILHHKSERMTESTIRKTNLNGHWSMRVESADQHSCERLWGPSQKAALAGVAHVPLGRNTPWRALQG